MKLGFIQRRKGCLEKAISVSSLRARVKVHVQTDSLSHGALQKSLHGNNQLTQEALDDWSALGKLILHLDLQHVRH